MASLVGVDVIDGTATIRLNRPDKLNAVTLELLTEHRDALRDLPEDEVDGLVITGAGDVTCAGIDREIVADPSREVRRGDQRGDRRYLRIPNLETVSDRDGGPWCPHRNRVHPLVAP